MPATLYLVTGPIASGKTAAVPDWIPPVERFRVRMTNVDDRIADRQLWSQRDLASPLTVPDIEAVRRIPMPLKPK
jgi:hypothetical protein